MDIDKCRRMNHLTKGRTMLRYSMDYWNHRSLPNTITTSSIGEKWGEALSDNTMFYLEKWCLRRDPERSKESAIYQEPCVEEMRSLEKDEPLKEKDLGVSIFSDVDSDLSFSSSDDEDHQVSIDLETNRPTDKKKEELRDSKRRFALASEDSYAECFPEAFDTFQTRMELGFEDEDSLSRQTFSKRKHNRRLSKDLDKINAILSVKRSK